MDKGMKYLLIGVLAVAVLVIAGVAVILFVYNCPCKSCILTAAAASTESLTIENAVVIPTDVSKIDYPSIFNNPTITRAEVINPYFAIERDEITYPAEYLGDYKYPQVNGAPLPPEIGRAVGLHDIGIPDWTFMDYADKVGGDARVLERQGFLEAMKRSKSLGADEITFTNMIEFTDFENAVLQPLDTIPISQDDFRFIANNAEDLGLNMTLYLNIFIGDKNPWDYPIPSGDWLATLIHNWESFVLNQAQLCEETGVDALMINHYDWQPYIKGYEDMYQTKMLALIGKVRTIYHGRILFMLDPLSGADLDKLSKLLSSVDGFIVNAIPTDLSYASDRTVSVSNLKGLYLTYFRNIAIEFNRFNKPYLIRVLIQSEKTFLENGWNEDTHCSTKGNDTCYQQHLEVDFSVQAIAYEAMLESIAQVHTEQSMPIYAMETNGYLFLDVILPHISQPQISQSIRDKPAEAIIYQWFKRVHQLTIQPPEGSGDTEPKTGTYTYDSKEKVHVSVMAKTDWHFDHWIVDGGNAGSEASVDVLMGSDHIVKAVFAPGGLGDLKVTVKGDDGVPINGVVVSSTTQPKGQTVLNGMSGADGSVVFSKLGPGNYTLQAQKNGYTTSTGKTSVTFGGTRELIITLQVVPTTGSLKVTVKDLVGTAIYGAVVSSASQPSGQAALSGTTGADGTIEFNNLLPGTYAMQASKSGYVPTTISRTVTAGSEGSTSFTL